MFSNELVNSRFQMSIKTCMVLFSFFELLEETFYYILFKHNYITFPPLAPPSYSPSNPFHASQFSS